MAQARNEARIAHALRLTFPDGDGPPADLFEAWRLDAHESLSRDFEIRVDIVSERADLDLHALPGKAALVELRRCDGSTRRFHGLVFEFSFERHVQRCAHYRIVLRPWLALLWHRRNHRIFHDQNVEQQTRTLLAEYAGSDWTHEALDGDRVCTDAFQLGDTDHDYLHRRWEDLGWHYRYEHRADGHRLVLGADSAACPAIDGERGITWRSADGLVHRGFTAFGASRRIASERYAATAYDYKQPAPAHASLTSLRAPVQRNAALESREYRGAYGLPADAAQAIVRTRLDELDGSTFGFDAVGNDDRVQAGRSFVLEGSLARARFGAAVEGREFLIVQARHTFAIAHEAVSGVDLADAGAYRCRVSCAPLRSPWRPGRGYSSAPPAAPSPQTATVVGPAGADLHTDPDNRVRVQFHWDREGAGDQRSSAWIRVATPWAGAENGIHSTPRVGAEVLVHWLDGNPDRPIILGCLHNRDQMSPWRLPAQQALTGIRTRELGGGGNRAGGHGNQLVFDDTPGQLQAQLRSDQQASELSLGHLTRIEDTTGRHETRGAGFELRSDGHGAIRGALGLLVSTEARANARAHATDIGETAQRLDDAGRQHEEHAQAAREAKAHEPGDQDDASRAIRAQHDALIGAGRALGEFEQPHLLLASPAGIASSTGGSTHQASSQHHAITSGAHTSLSAGRSLLVAARHAVRLYAHRLGIRLIAAAGIIEIKALTDSVHVLAKLKITETAETIELTATKRVVVNGGGSTTSWSASGIESRTGAEFVVHAAQQSLVGPRNMPVPPLPERPDPGDCLVVTLRSHVGAPSLAHRPVKLFRDGAHVKTVVSDASGRVVIDDHRRGTPSYALQLHNEHDVRLPVSAVLADGDRPAAEGLRAAHDDDTHRHRAARRR